MWDYWLVRYSHLGQTNIMQIETIKEALRRQFILAKPGDHYDPRMDTHIEKYGATASAFMTSNDYDAALAEAQHANYCRLLDQHGISTTIIDPDVLNISHENLHDLVYMADQHCSIYTINKDDNDEIIITYHLMLSNFANLSRQAEVDIQAHYLQQNYDQTKARYPNLNFQKVEQAFDYKSEGGDYRYSAFHGVMMIGNRADGAVDPKGGRTDIRAHKQFHALTNIPILSLEVVEPYFHLDTVLAPLWKGHMIIYPDGMSADSYRRLRHEAFEKYDLDPNQYCIEVSQEDAENFACNAVVIDADNILIPQVSDDLIQRITAKGYKVHVVDVSEFIKGAGALNCMKCDSNLVHIPGGLMAQPDFFDHYGLDNS